MIFANLTYLDSLNMYIVLCSYKALTGLSEKRLVSTKPTNVSLFVGEMKYLHDVGFKVIGMADLV
jgi:hypothetical protein